MDYEYRPSLNCNNVYYQTCTGNSNLSIYNYIYCRNCVMVFVCDQYYYYYESSLLTQLNLNDKLYYVYNLDPWCNITADSVSKH